MAIGTALPEAHLAERFELSEPNKLVTSLAEGVQAVRDLAAGLQVGEGGAMSGNGAVPNDDTHKHSAMIAGEVA